MVNSRIISICRFEHMNAIVDLVEPKTKTMTRISAILTILKIKSSRSSYTNNGIIKNILSKYLRTVPKQPYPPIPIKRAKILRTKESMGSIRLLLFYIQFILFTAYSVYNVYLSGFLHILSWFVTHFYPHRQQNSYLHMHFI